MKTVNIKGKEYIEVNERLKYFRSKYPNWSLISNVEQLNMEKGYIVIKACIYNEQNNLVATGYAYEKESSSYINKTSFVENCETSAWGRALGNLGIGIDTSVASAEEVQNAILNQKKDDTDIYLGLEAVDNTANALKYFREYENKVNDKEAFKTAYKKVYLKLKKKEENND